MIKCAEIDEYVIMYDRENRVFVIERDGEYVLESIEDSGVEIVRLMSFEFAANAIDWIDENDN